MIIITQHYPQLQKTIILKKKLCNVIQLHVGSQLITETYIILNKCGTTWAKILKFHTLIYYISRHYRCKIGSDPSHSRLAPLKKWNVFKKLKQFVARAYRTVRRIRSKFAVIMSKYLIYMCVKFQALSSCGSYFI